jgi:hypothetical protein
MLAMMLLQFFPAFPPKQLVLTFHGSEILRFHRNPIYRWLTRRLIRHATRISTLTGYTQDLLCAHFPAGRGKTILTPGALRSDFAVVPAPAAEAGKRIVVLTVGRLHPRKGQLITLQALQALAPDFAGRSNTGSSVAGEQKAATRKPSAPPWPSPTSPSASSATSRRGTRSHLRPRRHLRDDQHPPWP